MKAYITAKPLYVDLVLHPETESATVSSDKGSWTFRAGKTVLFKGLPDYVYMVMEVHPNGMTLINAAKSIPMFMSWSRLFGKENKKNSIWLDSVLNTGWMEVT
jgi:hypothetical protein